VIDDSDLLEELRNVVVNAPVWPGDTISGSTVRVLCNLGLVRYVFLPMEWYVPTVAGIELDRIARESTEAAGAALRLVARAAP